MISPPQAKRLASLLAASMLASCTFDPAVGPPGSGDAADTGIPDAPLADSAGTRGDAANNGGADGNGGGDDAARPRDVAAPEDTGTPDVATPPDVSVPPDASTPDMPPPPDGSQPIICGGRPVDPMTNDEHCGRCDNACDPDFGSCVDGMCTCASDGIACGDQNLCYSGQWDPNNCGTCGETCGPGELCVAGDCECRPGLLLCGGACIDPMVDPKHCGTCNNNCQGKLCLDGSCENRNSCPLGAIPCNMPGGTACLRGTESDLHCGPSLGNRCGTECGGDQFCYDPGFLSGPRCVTYRPGFGCTQCPCADCGGEEFCVETDDLPGVAFCVRE